MKKLNWIALFGTLWGWMTLVDANLLQAEQDRPNVLFIISDDLIIRRVATDTRS